MICLCEAQHRCGVLHCANTSFAVRQHRFVTASGMKLSCAQMKLSAEADKRCCVLRTQMKKTCRSKSFWWRRWGSRGQAPRICFANYPDYVSLVLRQGEPHEMDDGFDPIYTLSKGKRVANATLFPLVETVGIEPMTS